MECNHCGWISLRTKTQCDYCSRQMSGTIVEVKPDEQTQAKTKAETKTEEDVLTFEEKAPDPVEKRKPGRPRKIQ